MCETPLSAGPLGRANKEKTTVNKIKIDAVNMTNWIIITFVFFSLIIISSCSAQSDTSQIVIGKSFIYKSNILHEDRKINLYLPNNYSYSNSAYPVCYLLDGDYHFEHVTGLVSFLSSMSKIPEMIIVGIGNTDRLRDFSPTHTLIGYDGKTDSVSNASSGGAEMFYEFLSKELIPSIDKNYRTQPFRILVGHSHGGLFAIYSLLEHPNTFNAFITTSPNLWWDNKAILNDTNKISSIVFSQPCILFMSVANEGGLQEKSIFTLKQALQNHKAINFEWNTTSYPKDWHGSVSHISVYDGLTFIYSD